MIRIQGYMRHYWNSGLQPLCRNPSIQGLKKSFPIIWVVVTRAIFKYSDASHNRKRAIGSKPCGKNTWIEISHVSLLLGASQRLSKNPKTAISRLVSSWFYYVRNCENRYFGTFSTVSQYIISSRKFPISPLFDPFIKRIRFWAKIINLES